MRALIRRIAIVTFALGVALSLFSETSTSPRRILSSLKPLETKLHLRGLYFGTSRTYGTGLDSERHLVYPYLISDEVTNLAIRGTGSQFPSMCFKSMVGEDLRIDFVVFEYYMTLYGSEAKLVELAKRVRARFPDATMIFIMMPVMNNYILEPTGSMLTKVMEERKVPIQMGQYSPLTVEMMDKALEGTQTGDWKIQRPPEPGYEIYSAARAVGGHIWTPLQTETPSIPQIKYHAMYFFKDGIHFNKNGHAQIAYNLQNLLINLGTKRSDRVGDWDAYDECSTWYQSGNVTLEHSPMRMYTWAGTFDKGLTEGKHALEVQTPRSYIKIKNPTTKDLNLYLYNMVTCPDQKYPRVSMQIMNATYPSTLLKEVEVEPLCHLAKLIAKSYHMVRGTYIGKIAPGEFYLIFEPKEPKERPFRITGIALTEHGEPASMQGFFQ